MTTHRTTGSPQTPQDPTPLDPSGLTIVHVTHEAIDHMGGIGTVLAGLMTAPSYRAAVRRSILVGPLPHPDARPMNPLSRLGDEAVALLYSGADGVDTADLGPVLRPVEWAFNTRIVYGTRRLHSPGQSSAEAEVLLLDVTRPNPDRLGALKWMLFEHFGVDSRLYEHSWDYEEYCRLADPAYHALCALIRPGSTPSLVIAHEFMGMATALRCTLDRRRFRTAFHAHECSTARRLVETLPGHDMAFYPAMRAGRASGRSVEDIFGPQSDYPRHALVSRAHRLDVQMAVGPETAEELRFLSPEMSASRVRTVYNGVPAPTMSFDDRQRSRRLVDVWLERVLGYRPDYLVTHVTRPVSSKGLWRDQKLGHYFRSHLAREGRTAAYVLLTCGAPVRSYEQVNRMAAEYGWPRVHRTGYPDLDGPEVGIERAMAAFNEHSAELLRARGGNGTRFDAVLVNQFGFSRQRLGDAAPEDLTIHDLRAAADVELGLSTYEPFGIAPLEPLHAGAVCVPSSVSGCVGLARRAMAECGLDEQSCPLVLVADFVSGTRGEREALDLVHMSSHERDAREDEVCRALADDLARRLPRTEADRRRALELGQRLAERMSWDTVCRTDFLPAVHEALSTPAGRVTPSPLRAHAPAEPPG
jgi:hypothetical protein